MSGLQSTLVLEEGDQVFLVAPVRAANPSDTEVAGYEFGKDIVAQAKVGAPNPHIAWYGGHYVEADVPNRNGQMWTGTDLRIASVTPMLMPVTVMHDEATAVGLIADVALKVPEHHDVPRAKIETALALWKHRFPDVVEEAADNAAQGTLMQSMEALAPQYDCSECGMRYVKLPRGAERAQWCAHLKGEADVPAARILRQVQFVGTGLIFGGRSFRGADPAAHLDEFALEVAEAHERSHRHSKPRRKASVDDITIKRSEYDELKARPEKAQLDDVTSKLQKAESDLEHAEADKSRAEKDRDTAKGEKAQLEEQARETKLRDDRLDALGEGFKSKLGEKTKGRLTEQAGAMSDEDWDARLAELEEAWDVTRDAGKDATPDDGDKDETFTASEVASFGGGRGSGDPKQPVEAERAAVVGGLFGGS